MEFFEPGNIGKGEIEEKKSRFIAHVFPIKSEEEAVGIIEATKKRYWDARHNCYAFVLGNNKEIQRFSDDGEPQGTAGKPILEVLLNMNISNVLVIVTRYFGGTLLGTGGLVRAYGQSTKKGILATEMYKISEGMEGTIVTDYNSIGKLKYILSDMDIVCNEEYGAEVYIYICAKVDDYNTIKNKVVDITGGKAIFNNEGQCTFRKKTALQ